MALDDCGSYLVDVIQIIKNIVALWVLIVDKVLLSVQ